MRIQVRKCPWTGKLFEEHKRDKYIEHLKKVRSDLSLARDKKYFRNEWDTWLKAEKEKISEIDMIIPWFLENQKYIMRAANALNEYRERFVDGDEFTMLSFDCEYTQGLTFQQLSNSHSCPANGVTNWGRRNPGAPTSYPGWGGNITGTLKRLPKHMGSYPANTALQVVGIHTGSGGGGNERFGWDIKIFLDDWPQLGQQLVMEKLSG